MIVNPQGAEVLHVILTLLCNIDLENSRILYSPKDVHLHNGSYPTRVIFYRFTHPGLETPETSCLFLHP